MIAIIFVGFLIAGAIQYARTRQKVAIFSADRKWTEGKKPNVLGVDIRNIPKRGSGVGV